MSRKPKKFVTYKSYNDSKKCSGRLLGLVDDNEFFHLVSNYKARKKAFSAESVSLDEIARGYSDLNGLRLVMALRTYEGKSTPSQELFITDKLAMIAHSNPNGDKLVVLSRKEDYIELEETFSARSEDESG